MSVTIISTALNAARSVKSIELQIGELYFRNQDGKGDGDFESFFSSKKVGIENQFPRPNSASVNNSFFVLMQVLRDESIAESTAASLNAEETNKCLEETTRDSNTNGVETTLPENCKVKWGSNQKMVKSEANKMPDNSQVESGTIAFNSAAFAPTPDYIDNSQPLHNQYGSKVSESHTHVGRDQQSHGESSFPVLLGPIACSGSLSVRSDSSISTSTRSFAFPV